MKKALSILFIISTLLFIIGLISCEKEVVVDEEVEMQKYINSKGLLVDTIIDGIYIAKQRFGTGEMVKAGNSVTVAYKGTLLNGTVFDQSSEFEFKFMTDRMIESWEKALVLLRENDNVVLISHSKYAYGDRKIGIIPANSPLVFDITILEVK